MKRKKTIKKRHIRKRAFRFKGMTSPVIIVILLLAALLGVGANQILSSNISPSKTSVSTTPPPIPTQTTTNNRLSMETFWVSPIPTSTPKPTNTPVPASNCSTSVTDTMLIMDISGSMRDGSYFGGSKIEQTKKAAVKFVSTVSANPQSRVGLALFSDTSLLSNSLTSNFSAVTSSINAISANGRTCIQCGIKTGNDNVAVNKRPNIKLNAILLTDGKANRIIGSSTEANNDEAKIAAKNEALNGLAQSNITYYTIGFGEVDADLLQEIASTTGGTAYIAADDRQLDQFFASIAQQICR